MKPRKKFFGLKPDLLLLYAIVLGIYRPMSFVPWAMYLEGMLILRNPGACC